MWSITPECEKSLDRYEGYPSFYHKIDVAVTDPETGKIYYVMMYEMDENTENRLFLLRDISAGSSRDISRTIWTPDRCLSRSGV